NKHPALFIQVKPPGPASLALDSKRKEADDQMRGGFRPRSSPCRPPPAIAPDPDYLNDVAPADRWNCDLLDANGIAQMCQVVQDVIAMNQALVDRSS
ncbi:hypothetical protein BC826DRAFT_911047, partial [Russula brevipes]